MGYLRFFMRYLTPGLGAKLPKQSDESCYQVDLARNPVLNLTCEHGLTLYVILPADFDDKDLSQKIDWRCDEEVEIEMDQEGRNLPFYTRIMAYDSVMTSIPLQNELVVRTLGKNVQLNLKPLAHIGKVKVYRYQYQFDSNNIAKTGYRTAVLITGHDDDDTMQTS